MHSVVQIEILHSGLVSGFQHIHSMELSEDPIFPPGNFGRVYEAISINGAPPFPPQAVKILDDVGPGGDRRGLESIQKLQKKIIATNRQRKEAQKPGLESLPALCALPQFSFLGEIDGKQVLGYSANRLDVKGYLPFSTILEDEDAFSIYSLLSIEDRLLLAAELVEGFQALSDMSFLHADINAPNILINMEDCHLAIIDYDSGVVMDNPADQPSTFGKRDDWRAPELDDRIKEYYQNGTPVHADSLSDAWSVFIGVHYLLFMHHPLFFVTSLARATVSQYLALYNWPEISLADPLFRQEYEPHYQAYLEDVDGTPEAVMATLRVNLTDGFAFPCRRTTYEQWSSTFLATRRKVEIVYFTADKTSIVAGMMAQLSWSVNGAYEVAIDNGIGSVSHEGCLAVSPSEDRWYTLTARTRRGSWGSCRVLVRVWPVPVIRSLRVPACSLYHRTSVIPARIEPPQIDLLANVTVMIQIADASRGREAHEWLDMARARMPSHLPSPANSQQVQTESLFRQLKIAIQHFMGGSK